MRTGGITALPLEDRSVAVIVSSLTIHNIPGAAGRLAAIDEALRVPRAGGKLAIADIACIKAYIRRRDELGMSAVRRRLGWRMWWGGPWLVTHLVTATKPN